MVDKNGAYIGEIKELLRENNLNTEAAMRLMLVMQIRIIEQFEMTEAQLNEVIKKQERYPSIAYMFANNPKKTVLVIFLIFLLLYTIMSPITISDMRHAILDWMGIPHP